MPKSSAFLIGVKPLILGSLLLTGCGTVGRVSNIGRAPKMSAAEPIESPTLERSIATRLAPAADSAAIAPHSDSPSLFRTGAGALFQDQRASRIGDILTIKVNIADKADMGNSTSRTRDGSENAGAGSLFALEKLAKKVVGIDTSALIDTNSKSKAAGNGTTSRSETVNMTIAAVVTSVLPNGNLVVRGRQETRVNFELRELIVTGIVRPQDIARDNSIQHSQIAEARISYGGKGQLTDAQQARWGQQLLDIVSPF
jgi:flagellar L-ring protein precursor FlgH